MSSYCNKDVYFSSFLNSFVCYLSHNKLSVPFLNRLCMCWSCNVRDADRATTSDNRITRQPCFIWALSKYNLWMCECVCVDSWKSWSELASSPIVTPAHTHTQLFKKPWSSFTGSQITFLLFSSLQSNTACYTVQEDEEKSILPLMPKAQNNANTHTDCGQNSWIQSVVSMGVC